MCVCCVCAIVSLINFKRKMCDVLNNNQPTNQPTHIWLLLLVFARDTYVSAISVWGRIRRVRPSEVHGWVFFFAFVVFMGDGVLLICVLCTTRTTHKIGLVFLFCSDAFGLWSLPFMCIYNPFRMRATCERACNYKLHKSETIFAYHHMRAE